MQSRIDTYNPLNDDAQRPLAPGHRQQYGLNVAGGTDAATYYRLRRVRGRGRRLQASRASTSTPSARPPTTTFPRSRSGPTSWTSSAFGPTQRAKVASNADLQLSLGYLTSQLHLLENDNTLNSVIGSGDGSGYPQDINRGWFLVPAEIFAERNRQGVGRFTGGLTANWRPL